MAESLLRLNVDVLDADHLLPTFVGHAILVCLPRTTGSPAVAFPLIAKAAMDPKREIGFRFAPSKEERGFICRLHD
jgi:hypothetical protein